MLGMYVSCRFELEVVTNEIYDLVFSVFHNLGFQYFFSSPNVTQNANK